MMVHDSPLRKRHESYAQQDRDAPDSSAARPGAATGARTAAPQVEFITYGPSERSDGPACEFPATFGELQAEYAAIRKGAGLMDCPHRGTILITGSDRREFLNRMLTQELKDLVSSTVRPAFWLNRKGRIEADLLLIELGDQLLVDLDITRVSRTVATLGEYIVAEDVDLRDVTAQFHHIAVHGKDALPVIGEACGRGDFCLGQLEATSVAICDADVVVARRDQTGEIGIELIMPGSDAEAVWDALLAADRTVGGAKHRVRPIGWYAYNTARIEAGTPLFNVDFAADTLPHETGVLHDRVSFTKGCYLGQEIVARIESLGQPKQLLVGLKMAQDLLPEAGGQVFAREEDGALGPPIGVVTSSTISPMLGAAPIAFAMLKTAHAQTDTTVTVAAEGEQAAATVCDLCFYHPEPSAVHDSTGSSDDTRRESKGDK